MAHQVTTTAQPVAGVSGISHRLFVQGIDGALAVNFTGSPRLATAVNGQVPASLLRWRAGDLISVHLLPNELSVAVGLRVWL
jgi:hypothetical protein